MKGFDGLMVLYLDLVFFKCQNRPFDVLHVSWSALVRIYINCRTSLSSQFLITYIFLCHLHCMIWKLSLLLTWSLGLLCICLLLPSFSVSLPSMGPMLTGSHLTPGLLSPMATAMACTASFTASTAVCVVVCNIPAWLLPYFLSTLLFNAEIALFVSDYFLPC